MHHLKFRPWLILPFAVIAFTIAAIAVQSWTLGLLLDEDARGASLAWTRFISGKTGEFESIASGAPPTTEIRDFMRWIESSSRIYRYTILDPSGTARYVFDQSSGRAASGQDQVVGDKSALAAAKSRQPVVDTSVHSSNGRFADTYSAEVYVPTFDARGGLIAIVKVYLDQTAKRAEFARVSFIGAAAIAFLLLLAGGIPALGWYRGEREKRRAADRALFLANFDPLSNLANRTRLVDELTALLADQDPPAPLAVLKIDIDRFADLNNWLGLSGGDQIIRLVAERLRAVAEPSDVVARVSGDEFAIVRRTEVSAASIKLLADKIRRAVAPSVFVNGRHVALSACIGIALAPGDGKDAERLLKSAKLALAGAKAQGRGRIQFFTTDLDADMQARRTIEQAVTAAVANGGFAVQYQPICTSEQGTIAGFEALARLTLEDGSSIPPGVFVAAAERMGLIDHLGAWIMAEACRTAASWPEHISVSVNLSAQQFARPGIADMVAATLEEAGLAPHRLLLEITESVLLVGADPVLTELVQLKQLGARIVMDDFGTGYSSLSYLWQFPFDKIKIDGSFVVALDAPGSPTEKIMRTITGLGHSLGMTVCVEGVETEHQAARARALGCDEIQGFYFARPLSVTDLPALIMSDFRRSVDIHGEPDDAQTAARFDPAKSRKAIATGA